MTTKATKQTEKRLLVFDTETTGLPLHPAADLSGQPHIIEFGGTFLSCETGETLEKVHFLIKPPVAISAEITKITGIAQDDVAGALPFAKVMPQIVAAFHGSAGCLAHNSPFDEFMIMCELRRLGIQTFEWPSRLCTISLYRADFGYDPKLTQLYERIIGAKLDQRHRASSDVDALVQIVQKERLWKLI